MKCEEIAPLFTLQASIEISSIVWIGKKVKDRLEKASRVIATRFTHASDPRVKERRDRKGNVYYQVYDPHTQKSAVFGSEAEIRYWLEQRYAR